VKLGADPQLSQLPAPSVEFHEIKTLEESEDETVDMQDNELHATSEATITFLKRQAFLDLRTQALLELRDPPESSTPILIILILS
jgi:hypothetical protein